MTTPAGLTDRLYGRLPEAFRDADVDLELRRYLLTVLGDADELDALVDALLEGDLADPLQARPEWLEWLAQFVGVQLPTDATLEARRQRIADAAGFLSGTPRDIEAAARTVLIGTRSANVTPVLNGDEFLIGLRTLASETPDPAAVLAAIDAAGVRPAGFDVELTYYSASWDTLEAAYPTSNHWDAAGSWQAIEETGAGTVNPYTPRKYGEGAYGTGVYG